MQEMALLAAKSLGCRDMSRVDFLLDDDLGPFVLEINPIPGFTSHSLLPMAAAKIGITFEQLVNRIVEMAMKR
jgi:D-alanine-D-alanine ligase